MESSPGDLSAGTYAVVLQADADGLLELEQRLQDGCVPHRAIRENDPPYAGQLLAIGLTPGPKKEVRKHVSSLPLLR